MRMQPTEISLRYVPDGVLTIAEDSCRCGSCITHRFRLHEADVDPWPAVSYNWVAEGTWEGLDHEDAMGRLATTVWELGKRVVKAEAIVAKLSVDTESLTDTECRDLLEQLRKAAK